METVTDLVALISSSHRYLDLFDYDNYPSCFAEFERQCVDWFRQCDRLSLPGAEEELLDRFETAWAALPKRKRQAASFQDKQVLALFFSPAAERFSAPAAAFAEALRTGWNARYPKNRYLAGHYESILKGFDSNLLGLPLRKSKQNRRPG